MCVLSSLADRLPALTMCLCIVATLIGLFACPLESAGLQSAFRILSALTLPGVIGSFAWHMVRRTPYLRVVKIGYGIIPLLCFWLYLLSTYDRIREASARTQMINNGKQIGLGAHSFDDVNKRLPSDVRNEVGLPLLSWRVSICPYIEQAPLQAQFNLNQSWDSPHNRPFVEKMPIIYDSIVFQETPGHTPWQGFAGPGTAFEPGHEGLSLARDFPDGTSNTILFVEARQHVPWSKPADIPYGPNIPLPALGQDYKSRGSWPFCCPTRTTPRFLVCMADGAVRMMTSNITEVTMRALIVRNDGGPMAGWDLGD
jgi:hypothetical protein